MSVFLIIGPKSTLAAVECCPLVSHNEYADGIHRHTDGQTDKGQTVTLCILLDAASMKIKR